MIVVIDNSGLEIFKQQKSVFDLNDDNMRIGKQGSQGDLTYAISSSKMEMFVYNEDEEDTFKRFIIGIDSNNKTSISWWFIMIRMYH